MGKSKVLIKPAIGKKISFEELYANFSSDWEKKAEKLRIRRWEVLKQKSV